MRAAAGSFSLMFRDVAVSNPLRRAWHAEDLSTSYDTRQPRHCARALVLGCYRIVDDISKKRRQLEETLRAADEEFWQEYVRAASTWRVDFGPIHMPFVIGSQQVAKIYALFNALCFVVGVVLCFFRGILAGLGIALVVGSLFTFGAFVSQFWVAVYTREVEWSNRVHSEADVEKLQHLDQERSELRKRLEGLRDADVAPEGQSSEPAD